MSKRLIILSIILTVAVVLIVLFCAVFVLRDIEVQADFEINAEEIIKAGNVATGVSIFDISKEKVAENIERGNPDLGVESIEKKSPDKLIIKMFERKALFVMSVINETRALVLDRDLKILDIVENIDAAPAELIRISGHAPESVENFDLVKGVFLNRDSDLKYDMLFQLTESYYSMADGGEYLKDVLKIDLYSDKYALIFVGDDIRIQIAGDENVAEKVNYAYAYYKSHVAGKVSGVTVVNDGNGWLYKAN